MGFSQIGLYEITPGDPAFRNSWGTALNTNFSLIDNYTAAQLSKDVSGNTDIVLTFTDGSTTEAQNSHFVFTGTLTGNINVFYPQSIQLNFSVSNQTTGAFTLAIAADNGSHGPAGTTVAIGNGGAIVNLRSDGTNIAQRGSSLVPIATGKMLANESGSSALPTPTDIPVIKSQLFSSSGTFTIPANATANTVFKFTVVAGGAGGGGGSSSVFTGGGGGGSGGWATAFLRGFAASGSVPIVVGTGGTGGTSGSDGNGGNISTVSYSAVSVITCTGGSGGAHATGSSQYFTSGGASGGGSVSVGASGLTADSSITGGTAGGIGFAVIPSGGIGQYTTGGIGGGSLVGGGGQSKASASSAVGAAGSNGGGGGGAVGVQTGGGGGNGFVLVEWVL